MVRNIFPYNESHLIAGAIPQGDLTRARRMVSKGCLVGKPERENEAVVNGIVDSIDAVCILSVAPLGTGSGGRHQNMAKCHGKHHPRSS